MTEFFIKLCLTLFRYACGIEIDVKFVVTGGYTRQTTVAEFTEAGAVRYLPSFKAGRYNHACPKFVNDDGDTVSSFY